MTVARHPGGESLRRLTGGAFLMGSADSDAQAADHEAPVRPVKVRAFAIAACCVTNEEFAEFAAQARYQTDAERLGWSYVFSGFLPATLRQGAARPGQAPWWCAVPGANWRCPEGPGSDVAGRRDHPVVHVSWNDATAYCRWARLRLPTEPEWEYAARGGLDQARYPWGDELMPGGRHRCNIWQGQFPVRNTAEDGYPGTAPVDAFEPNGYGLFNTAGNVWEWCADWFGPDRQARSMRGGSYLCHDSYCNRYRVAARTASPPDSSAGNLGFRCARSLVS
jgi:formylglycine-generating enzyme